MLSTKTETTEKNLWSLVNDYVIYNQWANARLVDWLKSKPVKALERNVSSSFASIKETLIHIWDVERGWLGHLKQAPVDSFRVRGFNGSLEEVMEGIVKQSDDFAAYVASLSEVEVQRDCFFSIPYVGDHTLPRFEIIQHCMNHSTFHRGQLITIGHNVGLTDAPMTDYMFYLLRIK